MPDDFRCGLRGDPVLRNGQSDRSRDKSFSSKDLRGDPGARRTASAGTRDPAFSRISPEHQAALAALREIALGYPANYGLTAEDYATRYLELAKAGELPEPACQHGITCVPDFSD